MSCVVSHCTEFRNMEDRKEILMSALNEKPNAEELPLTGSVGMIVDGRYLPPPEDKDGKLWVSTSALIQRNRDVLYSLWRDVAAAPSWQEQITRVLVTGDRTSHWVMESDGKTIEWDSEIRRRTRKANRMAIYGRRF